MNSSRQQQQQRTNNNNSSRAKKATTANNNDNSVSHTSLVTVAVDMALVMLHVSPDEDDVVSAEDDTVAMEVKDSDDGSEALSEKAESVSPVSLLICSQVTVGKKRKKRRRCCCC